MKGALEGEKEKQNWNDFSRMYNKHKNIFNTPVRG